MQRSVQWHFLIKLILYLVMTASFHIAHQEWYALTALLGINHLVVVLDYGPQITGVLFWYLLASTILLLIRQLLDRHAMKHYGVQAPQLLKEISSLVIWIVVLAIVFSQVFHVKLTGLMTASSIVIGVIGFALRNVIADLFLGISIGLERSVKIGDWLEVHGHPPGRVVEMNWRSTTLVTKEELSIVVPNSTLGSRPFRNYSKPKKFFRTMLRITLDHDVTTHQAERIFFSAINQVPECADVPREPEIRIIEYLEQGVLWEVRFWVTDYKAMSTLKQEVHKKMLRNMHFSGVSVPHGSLELISSKESSSRKVRRTQDFTFMRDIELFSVLHDREVEQFVERCQRLLVSAGNPVVRQGDEGDSMYVVREGMMNVVVKGREGKEITVAQIVPGGFFGEMSLLTGAPRTASIVPKVDSVVLEITKEEFRPILESRSELLFRLGEILAERQALNLKKMDDSQEEPDRQGMAKHFLHSMRVFFKLGDAQPGSNRHVT
ncbi:MAG: mechanosensitive ion channel family protein [Magnetococcales bacterium]|nr:mechanosensitive ion channel family protein [Magnetococcales bacterium]